MTLRGVALRRLDGLARTVADDVATSRRSAGQQPTCPCPRTRGARSAARRRRTAQRRLGLLWTGMSVAITSSVRRPANAAKRRSPMTASRADRRATPSSSSRSTRGRDGDAGGPAPGLGAAPLRPRDTWRAAAVRAPLRGASPASGADRLSRRWRPSRSTVTSSRPRCARQARSSVSSHRALRCSVCFRPSRQWFPVAGSHRWLGCSASRSTFAADDFEIAEWFRIDIADLLVAPHTVREIERNGVRGRIHYYEASGRDHLGCHRRDPARAARASRQDRLTDQLGAATIF